MYIIIRNIILTIFLSLLSIAYSNNPQEKKVFFFTENKGQVHDQNYNPRLDVLFYGSIDQLSFFISKNQISYQINHFTKRENTSKLKDCLNISDNLTNTDEFNQEINRIDLKWIHSQSPDSITYDQKIPGYNNYYLPSCPLGALDVKSFKGITLNNIYNGINVHYYEYNGELKHDYIVVPGANYENIQLEVKGAKINISNNGSLFLTTPLGKIEEGAPIVFQNGKQLKAKWILKNNILSFSIENCNISDTLVIDPITRIWGTYYGGINGEIVYKSNADSLNNIFIVGGTTSSGSLLATSGAHQQNFFGNQDAFIAKFNSSGIRQWGTYYGDIGLDLANSMTYEKNSNCTYISGYSSSSNNTILATNLSHQSTHGGGIDGFLVKFNTNGVRQWGTYYGGSGIDYVYSCSSDLNGNVYICGITTSSVANTISTTGAHQINFTGSQAAFLAKFNASGVRQWGTYYGGPGAEYFLSCSTDYIGNIYATGSSNTTNSLIATIGAHQISNLGSSDAILIKFNSLGVRLWGTYYGDNSLDYASSCKTDINGNIYICGRTSSSISINNIATNFSHQSSHGGGLDGFLVKFNSSGVRQWGTFYGDNNDNFFYDCDIDKQGNIYACGTSSNLSTPNLSIATNNSYQSICGGAWDGILVKFNTNCVRQWGTYYGGNGNDLNYSCSTDLNGNVYISGQTSTITNTIIASSNSFQNFLNGGNDGFLVKLTDCDILNPTISYNNSLCIGSSLNFSCNYNGTVTPLFFWNGPNSFTSNIQNPTLNNINLSDTGIYFVTLSINGCLQTSSTNINLINPLPTITVNSGTICKGQSFTISPNGALTYTFLNGSSIVSPTISTSFSVIGSSSLGCISTSAAISSVTVINLPTITVNSGTICQGQSFTIIPNGAQTYTIQGGSFIVNPITNTSYTVTGTNSMGCKSAGFSQSNITVHLNPTISVNNGTICQGKSFTISPTGASTFSYQNNTNIVSPMVSSIYTVIGTNSNNCTSTTPGTCYITVLNSPTVSISNATMCLGNMFNILPTGANNYTIQGGQSVVSPSITTTYSIIGSNTLGCVSPTPSYFTLVVNNGPSLTLNSGTICAGNSFTLSPSGASTYTLQGNSYIVNPTITTTYSIIGTSTNGCISNIPAISTVSVFQKPLITVYDGSVCYGTSFNFSVNGVSAYSVLNYPLVFTPSVSGIYTIQGYSDKGCLSMNTPTAYVLVYNTPTIQILITSPTICAGSTVAIEAFGAQSYSWSPISLSSNSIITVLNTNTQFTITGINMYGCKKTETITVYITNCDNNSPGTISIFPNPANETLTLEVSPQYLGKQFTVVSTLGQYIFQDYIRYYKQQINLQLFSDAVYYIKVEGELKPYKFLKK